MSKRPAISAAVKVTAAIRQASTFICPLCIKPLWSTDPRRLEHMVPRELGGTDEPENLRWVHELCAINKDFGKSKATCADGDIHKIAKAKRIAAGGRKRKGPPMKSRGFDKSFSKNFKGETVRK